MRKHASSWGIKAILTMIILSFVLFFGYSRISSIRQPSVRGGGNQPSVAIVNKMAIPESEYRFYYDNALERLRTEFNDKPIPDFMKNLLEQSTMSQLVQRELLLQVADELDIKVSDQQLAEAIRTSQIAIRGAFDPAFYTNQYLPYFENRFGINFEDMLRNDLRAAQVQAMFQSKPPPAAKEKGPKETVTVWTYELVKLDIDKMLKEKVIASASEAANIAQQFVDHVSPGQWKGMARKYKADLETVEGVTLKDRRAKLRGFTFEDYQAIFALNDGAPVVDRPISRKDNTLAVVRLVEQTQQEVDPVTPKGSDFFQQWMTRLAAQSQIRTFLDDNASAKK